MVLARQVEDMYGHAFGSYMTYAFPADELRPLSCDGRRIRERGDLDAVLGNYSMTLIDALDSLVVFRRYDDFRSAVSHVCSDRVSFDVDIEVSTFEVNIRILGGLLSAHMHAQRVTEGYDGCLLAKATDLAKRLRPAFDTPAGLPLSRINLRRGKPEKAATAVTTAEAGSFLLEFGVLAKLTGDWDLFVAARSAALTPWDHRSALGMVGTTLDVNSGDFQDTQSTTGPGQDSALEYLLKGYILFDDLELLDYFHHAYEAVEQHHTFEGFTYTVDMYRGLMSNTHLSPLSCVWASLQVLAGDVAGALRTVLYWYGLWLKNGALPEVFDTKTEAPTNAKDSPLRPELAEALFYLSLALPGDPTVFGIAKSLITALDAQSRVKCGFASVADVATKRLDDRMDSFFLSETLVYLYLTVAPQEEVKKALPVPLHSIVFSTEGHIFPIVQAGHHEALDHNDAAAAGGAGEGSEGMRDAMGELFPGSAHRPLLTCDAISPFERVAVQQRCQTKYLLTTNYQLQSLDQSSRRCRPQEASVEIRLGADSYNSPPSFRLQGLVSSFGPPLPALPALFLEEEEDEFLLGAAGGTAAEAQQQTAGPAGGAPVLLAAACAVAAGRKDANETGGIGSCRAANADAEAASPPSPPPPLREPREPSPRPRHSELALSRLDLDLPPGLLPPFTAGGARQLALRKLLSTRLLAAAEPLDACSELRAPPGFNGEAATYYEGRVVLVARGSCLFLQKLHHVQRIGAVAALVINHEGSKRELQVMTCPLQERGAGRDVHIPAVMITSEDGLRLLAHLRDSDPASGRVTARLYAAQ